MASKQTCYIYIIELLVNYLSFDSNLFDIFMLWWETTDPQVLFRTHE